MIQLWDGSGRAEAGSACSCRRLHHDDGGDDDDDHCSRRNLLPPPAENSAGQVEPKPTSRSRHNGLRNPNPADWIRPGACAPSAPSQPPLPPSHNSGPRRNNRKQQVQLDHIRRLMSPKLEATNGAGVPLG